MRGTIVKVTAALLGLAGVVYAADQATYDAPAPEVGKTIVKQLVTEGELANAEAAKPHRTDMYSSAQMLELAPKYGDEMKAAIEHAETTRMLAYQSRDIIRMTCIDDKVAQMKMVISIVEPRYLMLRTFKSEEVVLRDQFNQISQAHDRVIELAAQIDACMGDNLDAVSAGRIQEEVTPNDTLNDPTRPPTAIQQIDRPPEASPYF
jgi:hypothetical protein